MFKKMLSAIGVGAPSVDTVLSTPTVQPGGIVQGTVKLEGGNVDANIEYLALGLITSIESEHGDNEWKSNMEFHRIEISGPFTLEAKEFRSIPFELLAPWETPITEVYGQHLRGMTMGIRTELAIAKAVDKGDLDALSISPLSSQLRVLEAFENLGFRFKGADLEQGRLHGVNQTLPFFQEIEFYPPHNVHGINEVEVTFVASPQGLDVILEIDSRGGFFSGGGDTYKRLSIDHSSGATTDWTAEISAWINHAASFASRPAFGRGGYGHGHHGHGGHYGHHGHGGHHRGGLGAGAVIAGVGAGLVGGYMAGEVMEDMFEDEED